MYIIILYNCYYTFIVEPKRISVRALDVSAETTKFSYENFLICDPRRWFHRYTVLILICMLTFGFYYCYDSLTALQRTIIYVSTVTGLMIIIYDIDKKKLMRVPIVLP